MKRILFLVLILVMVLGSITPDFAAVDSTGVSSEAADLYLYEVIAGTDKGLEEEKVLYGDDAAALLSELYGQRDTAEASVLERFFADLIPGAWYVRETVIFGTSLEAPNYVAPVEEEPEEEQPVVEEPEEEQPVVEEPEEEQPVVEEPEEEQPVVEEPADVEGMLYLSQRSDISGSIAEGKGSISNGSNELFTDISGSFKSGYGIAVKNAGNNYDHSGWLITEVVEVRDGVLILKDKATNSVSNTDVYHDDSAAINRAIKEADGPVMFDVDVFAARVNLVSEKDYYGQEGKAIYAPLYLNQLRHIWSILTLDGLHDVKVEGVTIEHAKYRGSTSDKELGTTSITMKNSDNIDIINNTMKNNFYTGVQLIGKNTNIDVINNTVLDSDVAVILLAEWQGSLQVENINIIDNYIDGGTSEGISIESGMYEWQNGYARNIKIKDNFIRGKESTGIFYGSRSTEVEISGNTIKDSWNGITTRDRNLEPIESITTSNVLISNNIIDNSTWKGLDLEGSEIEIINNTISNTTEAVFIGKDAPVYDSIIDGNTFINNGIEYGSDIWFHNANNITVTNNQFDTSKPNSSAIGIITSNVRDLKIDSNRINDGMNISFNVDMNKLDSYEITNNTLGSINYFGYSMGELADLGLTLENNTFMIE